MRENGAKPGLAGHIIERVDKPHILGQQIKQVINRIRCQRAKCAGVGGNDILVV